MFGHKRKYNHGRVGQGTWVFGMVERGTGRALAFHVPNRAREILVTGLTSTELRQAWNNNNLWQVFAILQPEQCQLRTPHGYTEGVWSQIKRKLKAMNGTVKSKLPSYLDKYNWQKCYPGDPFDNLLEAIAEFCQPNYASDIFLYTSDNILEETFFTYFQLCHQLVSSWSLSSHTSPLRNVMSR